LPANAPAPAHAIDTARLSSDGRRIAGDLAGRAIVGALFTLLSINLFADFLRTGHLTGLMMMASESLVVILTIVRRRAVSVDRSTAARVLTAVSVTGPLLLRVGSGTALVSDAASASVLGLGAGLIIFGKVSLGRSFGLVPANRGVVVRGPYTVVRHPIYAGYLVAHAGFLLAHPTWINIAIVLVADSALIVRALVEERSLSSDAAYQAYCARVVWHIMPGIF
jgi:protein-S-isoprenylcysteine O-methyltransferase Ste14